MTSRTARRPSRPTSLMTLTPLAGCSASCPRGVDQSPSGTRGEDGRATKIAATRMRTRSSRRTTSGMSWHRPPHTRRGRHVRPRADRGRQPSMRALSPPAGRRPTETKTTSCPISALSCSGVPRRRCWPLSMMATGHTVGRPPRGTAWSGTRWPSGVDPPHLLPNGQTGRRIQSGRRLVEKQHLG